MVSYFKKEESRHSWNLLKAKPKVQQFKLNTEHLELIHDILGSKGIRKPHFDSSIYNTCKTCRHDPFTLDDFLCLVISLSWHL